MGSAVQGLNGLEFPDWLVRYSSVADAPASMSTKTIHVATCSGINSH